MPPAAEGDCRADLTAAPIFDDTVYCIEALILSHGQSEDDLDTQICLSARESGIEDPYRYLSPPVHNVSTAMSTMTLCSEQRSSISIHSRETQSTGVTSHPSRTSKDHAYFHIGSAPLSPPIARTSFSLEDYDSVKSRFRPPLRRKLSSFTLSATPSTTPSTTKPATRKSKRGSGLFARFRKDSSSCTSRSHHGHHARSSSQKLECGHTLSKYALREHVQEAFESKLRFPPNCCGKPLPRALVETVLTKDELEIFNTHTLQSPDLASLQDSGYSEDGMSSIDIPHALHPHSLQSESFPVPSTDSDRDAPLDEDGPLGRALATEAFKAFRLQQKEQRQRICQFEAAQRKALSAYYQWLQRQLTANYETSKRDRPSHHIRELERLEEYQIIAEHEMRKAHAQETQNVATALKYMEAYCSGNNLNSPDVAHVVTDEDRRKLTRQYLVQQKLSAKHESAINVLRARQEKDTQLKVQKQEVELLQLEKDFEKDKRAIEWQHLQQSSRLGALIETRRLRLNRRWDLMFEVWQRDWESQHGVAFGGRLPHEEWPTPTEPDVLIDTYSSLAPLLQATACD